MLFKSVPAGSCARSLLTFGLVLAVAFPAMAVVNGADTSSFSAVGDLIGVSGVQVSDSWVLTAAHVARGVAPGAAFEGLTGASTVDAVYLAPDSAGQANDLALLHLRSPIAASLPVLNGRFVTAEQAATLGDVTIVSAQNNEPNGYGVAQAYSAMTVYDGGDAPATVNWLITKGNAAVDWGDSGGALFLGATTDSEKAVLLGIVSLKSVEFTYDGDPSASAYVQLAPYRAWIDQTMAPSGEQAIWVGGLAVRASAPTPVPEPSMLSMYLCCAMLVFGRRMARGTA